MLLLPSIRFAHEVYVLTPAQVSADKQEHINLFSTLQSTHNLIIFLLFSFGALALLALLLKIKFTSPARRLDKLIDRGSVWAPDFIRVIFGASLIFSAMHNSLFGPELPLSDFSQAGLIKPLLYICGTALIVGLFTRLISLVFTIIWLTAFAAKGWYMLTYINYLGEALALILVRYQSFGLDRFIFRPLPKQKKSLFIKPEWALPVIRILFGFSLLYAAFNIKFLHPNVSLDVVNRYHLTNYFPFDPLMVVFGAAMTEVLIAMLFMVGLLQRFNIALFVIFVILSLAYFKESVWPHYLLFGIALGIFFDKPDVLSLDRLLERKYKK